MLTRKTAAAATAVLLLSIPAGVALAADDEAVTEAPVATCDQEQVQLRRRLHDPAQTGELAQEQTQTRQRIQTHVAECDGTGMQAGNGPAGREGPGPQAGYGPGAGQGNGAGAGDAIRARAQDGDCDGTGPQGPGGRNGRGS